MNPIYSRVILQMLRIQPQALVPQQLEEQVLIIKQINHSQMMLDLDLVLYAELLQ